MEEQTMGKTCRVESRTASFTGGFPSARPRRTLFSKIVSAAATAFMVLSVSAASLSCDIWLTDTLSDEVSSEDRREVTNFQVGSVDLPVVCTVTKLDEYVYWSLNVRLKIELLTTQGTFSEEVPITIPSGSRGYGYAQYIATAVNLPSGSYTVRVTVSCDGYTSATKSTTLYMYGSSYSLAEALDCEDVVSKGLLTLSSSSLAPWIASSDGFEVFSGNTGKNGQSVLTMKAYRPLYYEFAAVRVFGSVSSSSSADKFEVYEDFALTSLTFPPMDVSTIAAIIIIAIIILAVLFISRPPGIQKFITKRSINHPYVRFNVKR